MVEGHVNDRRRGNTLYMPVATSISNLIKPSVDALERVHASKTLEATCIEVPSLTWATLQFCAKNPLCSSSLIYTSALTLTHKVHQRVSRATSTDSYYVAAAYKYMRIYGLRIREQLIEADCDMSVISASCDDKCKVKPSPSKISHLCFPSCAFVYTNRYECACMVCRSI